MRGRDVVLVDRRGAAEETSYGNTGVIQREATVPYTFPREWRKILTYALNRSTEAHMDWRWLPALAPSLYRYWSRGELRALPDHMLRDIGLRRDEIDHIRY